MVLAGERTCSVFGALSHPLAQPASKVNGYAPFFPFLARTGKTKAEIKEYVETRFGYDLNRTCDEIRPDYVFEESCQGTIPAAMAAFLDSTDFETAVRLAVSLGGDSDTIACITGGIAEAFYGHIPEEIVKAIWPCLPDDFQHILQEMEKAWKYPLAVSVG